MSLALSPKIITDGLVFAYDMANTKKSWKGMPTTNLRPTATFNSMNTTYSYIDTDSEGWKKYSISGTWAAGTYPYSSKISSTSFTGGVTYSTGVYIKCNCMDKFAYKWTGMNYVNAAMNSSGTSFSIAQPDGSLFVGRRGFNYVSTTIQPGYFLNRPLSDGTTFNPSTDFVWMKDPQIEVGEFCTPFVNGTRSNTEAIVDLTGQNTITANSLTYNSDNTFSFGTTSDVISTQSIDHGTNDFTYSYWVKCDAKDSIDSLSENGDYRTGILTRMTGTVIQIYANYTALSYHKDFPFNPDVGKWYNIVFSRVGDTMNFYVNGVFSSSQPFGTNMDVIPSTDYLYIGSSQHTTAQSMNGQIAVVKIYSKSLNASEVKQNFYALRGRYGI